MPNWIGNNVTVSGDEQQMNDFFSNCFTDGSIDFEKIIPSPKTKEECPEKYICDCKKEGIEDVNGGNWFNWYKWRIDKWGVKWNACDGYIHRQGDFFYFATPWGIPYGIYEKLTEMYQKLKFEVEIEDGDEPFTLIYKHRYERARA